MLSDLSSGRENNLSLMRLIGALFVLWGHSYALVLGPGGHDPISELIRPYTAYSLGLPGIGVSLFFIISGFLITKSYLVRQDISAFIKSRVLRIFPALIVAVSLSVFVLGPLFTSLDTISYFSSKMTWSYFWTNASLVDVQYRLPGVFSGNPRPGVNGSLWTLPVELRMYILAGVFGLLGFLSSRSVFNVICFFLIITFSLSDSYYPLLQKYEHYRLAIFFLIGAFFYINAKYILLSIRVMLVFLILTVFMRQTGIYELFFAVSFSYLMLLIAYHPAFIVKNIEKYGDYSYGIYIYAFPVQQLVIFLEPKISIMSLNIISIPIIFLFAFMSWHLIEKRALKLKGYYFLNFSRQNNSL